MPTLCCLPGPEPLTGAADRQSSPSCGSIHRPKVVPRLAGAKELATRGDAALLESLIERAFGAEVAA
jgi:hypothetical protein